MKLADETTDNEVPEWVGINTTRAQKVSISSQVKCF